MAAAVNKLTRRPSRCVLRLAAIALACWLLPGCAESQTEVATGAVEPAPSITPASMPPKPAPPREAAAADTASSAVTPTPDVAAVQQTVADYQPPFPERIDLFVAPKRAGGGPATDGAQQNSVELMGFVRVDRQRAVLSIDGNVAPVAEGETQFGVEVLSIKPPMVVLQRGRQQWQATLE